MKPTHCLLLAILLAVASSPSGAAAWKFFVVSDTQSADAQLQIDTNLLSEFMGAVSNEAPSFVLCAGDLVNHPVPEAYQIWTNIMAPVYASGIPIYSVLGNHDAFDPQPFSDAMLSMVSQLPTFEPVKKNYAFSFSNALFLMLETHYPQQPLKLDQQWLDAVLLTNRLPHVFAIGHEPAFKNNYHRDCLDNYPLERDVFWNSLSNAHARIYFCGHDHRYNHARLDDGDGNPDNDVYQIVLGSMGGYIYPDGGYDGTNSIWTPVPIFKEAANGFIEVQVDGPTVSSIWRHRVAPGSFPASAEVFSYSLDSTQPAPTLHVEQLATGLSLNWNGPAQLQATSEINGAFTNIPGAVSPFVLTNFTARSMFFRLSTALE